MTAIEPAFLLDSNICICLLEGLSSQARARVESFEPGKLVTSAVVYAEVLMGADRANDTAVAMIEAFFDVIEVRPFGAAAGRAYAELPFWGRSYGRLVAAHAISLGLPLVTSNIRDFFDIPGLQVEDWTQA